MCKCALVLLVIDSTLMLYLLACVLVQPTQLMMAWSMLKVSVSKLTPEWDKVRFDRRAGS